MNDEVLFKNEFYRSGLTKGMVINHYQKYRPQILKYAGGKFVILFMWVDNKWIVKRNIKGSSILLKKGNYDEIFHPRVISLGVDIGEKTNKIIIDIDPPKNARESDLKFCLEDILNSTLSRLSIINGIKIISSATSYHIWFYLKHNIKVEVGKQIAMKSLGFEFKDKYSIGGTRGLKNKINIDFSSIQRRGSYLIPYALCRNGLMSVNVTKSWKTFTRTKAIIK